MAGISQPTAQAGAVTSTGLSTGFNSADATVGPTDPLSSNPLGAPTAAVPEFGPGDIPVVGGAITAASSVEEATKSVTDIVSRLFDPIFWKGAGLIIIGGVIAVIGLGAFFHKGQNITVNTPPAAGKRYPPGTVPAEAAEVAAV